MLLDVVRGILLNDAGVSAVVGTRVFAVLAPEAPNVNSDYPMIVFFTVDADEWHTLDRTSGLVHERVQFDAYGNKPLDVKRVQKLVRTALESAVGRYASADGNVNINGVLREDEADSYDHVTRSFRCRQDFKFFYNDDVL